MQDNFITLTDENGNDTEFEFLDMVVYENQSYVVLLPRDDDEGIVMILRIDDLGTDKESYATVDDNAILVAVYELFKERNKDTFDFSE